MVKLVPSSVETGTDNHAEGQCGDVGMRGNVRGNNLKTHQN